MVKHKKYLSPACDIVVELVTDYDLLASSDMTDSVSDITIDDNWEWDLTN